MQARTAKIPAAKTPAPRHGKKPEGVPGSRQTGGGQPKTGAGQPARRGFFASMLERARRTWLVAVWVALAALLTAPDARAVDYWTNPYPGVRYLHRVDTGVMQIGALTAFLNYLVQILTSVMMATFISTMIPRAAVCAERRSATARSPGRVEGRSATALWRDPSEVRARAWRR